MGIQEVVVDKRRTRRAHRASKFKLILFLYIILKGELVGWEFHTYRFIS